MRTFLAIIGALALLLVGVIAVLIFIGARNTGPILKTAHEYTDDTIKAVGAEWDVNELLARASPEMRNAGTRAQFKEVTDLGKRSVGSLTSAQPAECTLTNYTYSTGQGELAQASCTTTAAHERGTVSYRLNLIYRDGNWKILLFVFNAEIAEDAPVQVDFTTPIASAPRAIAVSLKEQSVSFSQQAENTAGIRVNLKRKIDNLTAQ